MSVNLDTIAFGWFLCCWWLFGYYADHSSKTSKSLIGVSHFHYIKWMSQMLARQDRLVDTRILEMITTTIRFFGSTTIFILAGLVTFLSYGERGIELVSYIPYAVKTDVVFWYEKTLLLIVIFIYSFFKHTWAVRQYNYVAVLMVSASPFQQIAQPQEIIERLAHLVSSSARHFNVGLRAYYFGLAALGWYIHPVLFMLSSSWVVVVLYRREFHSKVLRILSNLA